jgi:hypothetical protein
VVILALGAGAVVLSLGQARHLLQRRNEAVLSLPDGDALAGRLGIVLPSWMAGVPLLEVGCALVALSSVPELPWALLAAAGLARLWRWFAQAPA